VLAALPPLNIFRMLAHAESAFRPYLRFGGALLSEDLELDPVARELAILQVARLFEAEYEWIQHVAVGKAVGVTDEQIAALERGDLQADAFDDAQRALLRFATAAMTTTRASDEDFTAAREHYSPRVIVEVLLVCGAYAMLARVMTSLDLDLDAALGAEVLERARGSGGEGRS